MSPDQQPRQLARWARAGLRRPRLWPRLRADLGKVSRFRGWPGPDAAGPAGKPAAGPAGKPAAGPAGKPATGPQAPLPQPAAVARAVAALRGPRGLRAEGGDPPRLPAGGLVLVANHPIARAHRLVLSQLDRTRRLRVGVVSAPVSQRSRDRLAERLREGGTVLVFPEGPPTADGGLGEFGPDAAQLARRAGVPVVPVGIRGALTVGAPDPAGQKRARVGVRFGAPLAAEAEPADQRAAVQALLAEDADTWWQVRRHADEPAPPEPSGWRQTWAQTAPVRRGGVREAPRIWR